MKDFYCLGEWETVEVRREPPQSIVIGTAYRITPLVANGGTPHGTAPFQAESAPFTLEALLDLGTWIDDHRQELEAVYEADKEALRQDSKDMARIAHEWREYRNEGLGTGG